MNQELLNLLEKIKVIQEKKRNDYTSSTDHYENFKRAALVSGWFTDDTDKVFVTLITTKLARLASLLDSNKVPSNESIEDSFLDLTTYCALWSSYHESKKSSNLIEENVRANMEAMERSLFGLSSE